MNAELILIIEKQMKDEVSAVAPGDIVEVKLLNFDKDLCDAPPGVPLQVEEIRNLRNGPARGVPPRSYRVRVVRCDERTLGDMLLYVVEEQRGTENYGAIPIPVPSR